MNPLLLFLGSICDPDFLAFFHWLCQIVWSNCLIGQHRNPETKREQGTFLKCWISEASISCSFVWSQTIWWVWYRLWSFDINWGVVSGGLDVVLQKIYIHNFYVKMALLGPIRARPTFVTYLRCLVFSHFSFLDMVAGVVFSVCKEPGSADWIFFLDTVVANLCGTIFGTFPDSGWQVWFSPFARESGSALVVGWLKLATRQHLQTLFVLDNTCTWLKACDWNKVVVIIIIVTIPIIGLYRSSFHKTAYPKFKFSTRLVQWTPIICGKVPLNESVLDKLIWQA